MIRTAVSVTILRTDFRQFNLDRVVSIVDSTLDLDSMMLLVIVASPIDPMHLVGRIAIHLVINVVEFQQSRQMYVHEIAEFVAECCN